MKARVEVQLRRRDFLGVVSRNPVAGGDGGFSPEVVNV